MKAGRGSYVYRVQFVAAGRSNKTTPQTDMPLEHGQWLIVDGIHLVVERIVLAKRGDPFDGLALCKPALG